MLNGQTNERTKRVSDGGVYVNISITLKMKRTVCTHKCINCIFFFILLFLFDGIAITHFVVRALFRHLIKGMLLVVLKSVRVQFFGQSMLSACHAHTLYVYTLHVSLIIIVVVVVTPVVPTLPSRPVGGG